MSDELKSIEVDGKVTLLPGTLIHLERQDPPLVGYFVVTRVEDGRIYLVDDGPINRFVYGILGKVIWLTTKHRDDQ